MPQFIREENVKRRLDADESSGFAMARFVLRRGDPYGGRKWGAA
jgi:hypothetical protein